MKLRGKEKIIESLKPYKFDHAWNMPKGETNTIPYYNNLYAGNGYMDMYIDAVGSQALPFQIIEKKNFVYVDGIDQLAGEPHSTVLNMNPLFYHTNTHPVISANDNWAKQAYNEFNNMDKSRKLVVTQYFAILHSGKDLDSEDRHRLENVYEKSQKAILIQETYDEANEFEKEHEAELTKKEFEPINNIVEDSFEKSKDDDFNED